MTAKDRQELIRIVKARFKLLRNTASARAYEIHEARQQAVNNAAKDKLVELRTKNLNLKEQMKAAIDPFEAKFEELKQEARDNNIDIKPGYTLFDGVEFSPKRVDYYDPNTSKGRLGLIGVEIERIELSVLEDLIVGQFEGDEAKKFLDRIPTVEQLMQGEVQEIEASND